MLSRDLLKQILEATRDLWDRTQTRRARKLRKNARLPGPGLDMVFAF